MCLVSTAHNLYKRNDSQANGFPATRSTTRLPSAEKEKCSRESSTEISTKDIHKAGRFRSRVTSKWKCIRNPGSEYSWPHVK